MDTIFALLVDPHAWVALVMLIAMEVVLGIDNLIFISILTNKLPAAYRRRARRLGLGLALGMRLGLLSVIAWIVHLTYPVIEVFGQGFSWRDMILIGGGAFLLWKATREIHESFHHEVEDAADSKAEHVAKAKATGKGKAVEAGFTAAIIQIILIDLVFSLDSIITAVGMTEHLPIMVVAVVVAVGTMLWASGPLAAFIEKHPTIVMLALGFLLMIGMALVAEGLGFHIPRGYLYFAMAFSAAIEVLNILQGSRGKRASR